VSAADSALVSCPYCGELIELLVDCPDWRQEYVEDCPVCCQPIEVCVQVARTGVAELTVAHQDEA
jgi:uncharacterized protein (UPF0212 family)